MELGQLHRTNPLSRNILSLSNYSNTSLFIYYFNFFLPQIGSQVSFKFPRTIHQNLEDFKRKICDNIIVFLNYSKFTVSHIFYIPYGACDVSKPDMREIPHQKLSPQQLSASVSSHLALRIRSPKSTIRLISLLGTTNPDCLQNGLANAPRTPVRLRLEKSPSVG